MLVPAHTLSGNACRSENARCRSGLLANLDGSLRFCQELFRCAQRSTRDDSVVARNELWRLSATLDVRGVTAMQPELYFYEQWLRERHADIQAAVRAVRLRPQQDCAARDVDPNPVKEVQVASIEEPDAVPVWKDIGSSFLKLRDFLWRTRLPS